MSPKRSKDNAGLPSRVVKKHGAFYYLKPIIRNNKTTTLWVRLGTTEHEMYIALAELKNDNPGLMSAIIDKYRTEILTQKAKNTQQSQGKQLDRLKRTYGHMQPRELRPVHIAQYHDIVGKKAPYQANRELALMTHVCKYAVRWGYIDDNPCREIQRFPEHARERHITHHEYLTVRDSAPLYIQVLMDLAYLTGQRRVDLLSLKTSAITKEGVTIRQSKTKKTLLIEWTQDLRQTIKWAQTSLPQKGITSMYIICNANGAMIKDAAFTTAWTRLMDKCINDDNHPLTEKFQFRDIRAKAGTESDGEHLGHTQKSTLEKHYKRLPKKVKPTQ